MVKKQNNIKPKLFPLEGIVGLIMNTLKMIRYNLKIIFGNRFIYFLLSAIALTLLIVGVNLFNGEAVGEAGVYRILTLTGALLLFYPAAFGIQSDKDARTMEIIFGIPDYRYRVWFLRLMLIYAISIFVMFVIALLLRYTFESFSISLMIVRVLFPLAFLGFFTFYLSTVVRSGNATAAIVIVLGIILLILSDEISKSYWNVFFNPYENPSDKSELVWRALTTKNRIFLGAGSIVFLLGGLMNLQRREKLLG
ncbi:MAG: hypothetical protein PF541_13205 [Prolixibacteraceae bacterium]|jgi:hypothetical protein|nr:hypothetical protein [Prolixibacteraceae bacterium]